MSGAVILAAGGTGGHVFPALAVAQELTRRGARVILVTDDRGARFETDAGQLESYSIAAATLRGRGVMGKVGALIQILRGITQAIGLLRRLQVRTVIGFGGYPSLPMLAAACILRRRTIIHEQNAVLGRVNRLLAHAVDVIATAFADTQYVPARRQQAMRHVGNPVRDAIRDAADADYKVPGSGNDVDFNLAIFGGSQGARILSDVVPAALSALSEALRLRLRVVQQCRPEDVERVTAHYHQHAVKAEIAPFFADIAERMQAAHLLITRAGAGAIAELQTIGRPAVLVPYAAAMDDHQTQNAKALVAAGGAWQFGEAEFKATALSDLLAELMEAPERLRRAAQACQAQARPDAARHLADLALQGAG